MEISNLPDKESKIVVLNMFTKLKWRMNECRKCFNNKIEIIRENHSELKNSITEKKNMLEQINSNLDDIEEQIRDPEERILEITESE